MKIDIQSLIRLQHHARQLSLFQSRQNVDSKRLGGYASSFRGSGMDFAESRLYANGDDIRMMHWGLTARTGKAHVKLYHEERERPVYLLIDFAPSLYFGSKRVFKSVLAAECAALLGWAATLNGDRVGAFIMHGDSVQSFSAKSRKWGILPILNACINALEPSDNNASAPSVFLQGITKARKIIPKGSLVMLITDGYHFNNDSLKELLALARHSQLFTSLLYDPLECHAPPQGHYTISDGRHDAMLSLSTQKQIAQYESDLQQLFSAKFKILKQLNSPYCLISTEHSPLNSLQKGLKLYE